VHKKEHTIELKFTVNSNLDDQVPNLVKLLTSMVKPSMERFGAERVEIAEKEMKDDSEIRKA
jgi:hypothetical protein